MSATTAPVAVVLGSLAGVFAALAVHEAVAVTPRLAGWVRVTAEPLARVGRDGYVPDRAEMRRLGLLAALLLGTGSALMFGPGAPTLAAAAGPLAVAKLVDARARRWRRSVEADLSKVATALADALSAGGGASAAIAAASGGVRGPAGAELRRVACELSLGVPLRRALAGMSARTGSARVGALAGALGSTQIGAGETALLLRRFAAATAERERALADARAATAQARFTGLIVVAMPAGAGLFAELAMPGFAARLLAEPVAAVLLALAAGLQLLGLAVISRLSRAGE